MTTLLFKERYNVSTQTEKFGVVVHTTEGGEDTPQDIINLLQHTDSRIASDGYGAGYSAVAENDTYLRMADDGTYVFAAPPMNAMYYHIVIAGKAGQTREQWLDEKSRPYIKGVAVYIYDMWKHCDKKWPLVKKTVGALRLGWKYDLSTKKLTRIGSDGDGYCGHADVALAFKASTHTDPGINFPWDILAQDIQDLINAEVQLNPSNTPSQTSEPTEPETDTEEEEDTMKNRVRVIYTVGDAAGKGIWLWDGITIRHDTDGVISKNLIDEEGCEIKNWDLKTLDSALSSNQLTREMFGL